MNALIRSMINQADDYRAQLVAMAAWHAQCTDEDCKCLADAEVALVQARIDELDAAVAAAQAQIDQQEAIAKLNSTAH